VFRCVFDRQIGHQVGTGCVVAYRVSKFSPGPQATSKAAPTAAAALIAGVILSSIDVISSRVLAGERGCWR